MTALRGLIWQTRRLEKRIIEVTSDHIFLVITSHRKEFMRLLEFKMWAKELPSGLSVLSSTWGVLPVCQGLSRIRRDEQMGEMKYNHFWLVFIFEYYGNVSWCFCMSVCLCLCLSLSLPLSTSKEHTKQLTSHPGLPSMFSLQSQHSQGLQKLFPQVSPAGKHKPVLQKYSSCKEQLLPGLWVWPFTQELLPHASHPWSICAGIKKGPLQFSRSSQQAPHTRCGLCRLSSRPFCSLSGIRVHTSQIPPGSWSALERMGQRGAMVREAKKKSAPLPILHFSLCSAQQTKVQIRVRERGFTFET